MSNYYYLCYFVVLFYLIWRMCVETVHYYQCSDAELSSALCVIAFDSWADNIADCQSYSNSDYLHFTLLSIDSYIGTIRKSQKVALDALKKLLR